jgi:hypothetical protein
MRTAAAAPLGLTWDQVQQSHPIIKRLRVWTAPEDCPKPRLGKLCGARAAGAIAGIALGCAAFAAIILATLIYSYSSKNSTVVVLDDKAWQNNYTHIIPTNLFNSPYITQYAVQPVEAASQQAIKYAFV